MASCIALTVFLFSSGSQEIKTAQLQLNQISETVSVWDTTWLVQSVRRAVHMYGHKECEIAPFERLGIDLNGQAVWMTPEGDNWVLTSDQPLNPSAGEESPLA